MQIDVPTLYALTIGTLCVAAAATLWERRAQPKRSAEFLLLTAACAAFGAGCMTVGHRDAFPGISGSAFANILMTTGYALVLWTMARFDRRPLPVWPLPLIAAIAAIWGVLGAPYLTILWNYISSFPIAVLCCASGWVIGRSRQAAGLRSHRLVAAISIGHGLFYLGRATVLPVIDSLYGPEWLQTMAAATMFEAVLYSVAMPMSFIALVREEAQRDLLTLSQTDHLTQLGNRQAFFQNGERLLAECSDKRDVTLLAFDLDHFKSINDRYGHAVGDEVLKLFGRVLTAEAGPEACLARLGGEEFAALLPGRDTATAQAIAGRVGTSFSAEAARRDGPSIHASVSIGLAERTEDVSSLSALLLVADRALYRAKQLGRNRVELASEPMPAAVRQRKSA